MENNLKDQYYKNMSIMLQMETLTFQAESVAFVVCSAFGLDTAEYSFPYIAGWSSGKEMTELKASMDVIRQTSSNLIKSIEKEVQHLLTEKEKQKFLDAHANDTISFYVADDMDYPISGDFWEYQTLEEAWDLEGLDFSCRMAAITLAWSP